MWTKLVKLKISIIFYYFLYISIQICKYIIILYILLKRAWCCRVRIAIADTLWTKNLNSVVLSKQLAAETVIKRYLYLFCPAALDSYWRCVCQVARHWKKVIWVPFFRCWFWVIRNSRVKLQPQKLSKTSSFWVNVGGKFRGNHKNEAII